MRINSHGHAKHFKKVAWKAVEMGRGSQLFRDTGEVADISVSPQFRTFTLSCAHVSPTQIFFASLFSALSVLLSPSSCSVSLYLSFTL